MIYTLMNKNAELFDMEMTNGNIRKIENIHKENQNLLPVRLSGLPDNQADADSVTAFWRNRRIPASRDGIKELLCNLNNISLDALAEKSLGLSLSDQYWIRPSKKIKWQDVNFFTNEFSEGIGDLLITGEWNGRSLLLGSIRGRIRGQKQTIGNFGRCKVAN